MLDYSEEAVRGRFLEEVARLKEAGAFLTDAEFCKQIKMNKNYLSELQQEDPRRVSLKALYYARERYGLDVNFCVFGEREQVCPGPQKELKELSKQGAHLKKAKE